MVEVHLTECDDRVWPFLESRLDLRDSLDAAKSPIEVIAAVHAAIDALRDWKNEGKVDGLHFQITDGLDDIHREISAHVKEYLIPREYTESWETAQQELDAEIQRYSGALEKLRTTPCASQRERQNVRGMNFGASIPASGHDYSASITDPAVFENWKQQIERLIQDNIDKYNRIRKRLADNAPLTIWLD